MMIVLVVAGASCIAMEPFAAAVHRWIMHGRGWSWHRSHHARPAGRFQRNDGFPLVFAAATTALMAAGYAVSSLRPLVWVTTGISAYGVAYLAVHDVCIHGRLGRPVRSGRYMRWVRAAHARHHAFDGAPYGFLLPIGQRNRSRLRSRSTDDMLAVSSGSHS